MKILVIFIVVVTVVISIIWIGKLRFEQMVSKEINRVLSAVDHTPQMVTEADLVSLPKPVKKWLISSGMVGKPYIRVGKVLQNAEMKLKPEQKNWTIASAFQYTTTVKPAFIWTVSMKMNPLMYVNGRDKYMDGKGEMLIKLNSVINVVNEKGDKLTEGTLQRYLGEMVWFPSLALSRYITWKEVNDTTATATMEYQGVKGSGTFHFNGKGDFTRFVALRYMGNDETAKRFEWVLDVDSHKVFEGIKVPAVMTATWKLDDQDWTWLKLEIKDVMYNEQVVQ